MASVLRNSYRYLQRQAHENPVIFYSCIIGAVGPVLAVAVPPIRRNYFGYVEPPMLPKGYPVPIRPRRAVTGYDDEE